MIRDGKKSLEVRVGYSNLLSISAGNRILFISGPHRQVAVAEDVRKYTTFDEMIANEDFRRIIPGLTKREVLRTLKEIYAPEKEALGVVVIEIHPVQSAEANP